ncbi:hypothetical protein [uncultured Rhodospira sp.]|uniref:hypothetical protein n=1 Tax=uncultured Rhodospira sp. TaxID=1936189 RepID=UPI00262811A7|nr:hypothetical protein [uncultured Rhodospira sp.]
MTTHRNTPIRVLAGAARRFACDRPEHLLNCGTHTPLSQGIDAVAELLKETAGAAWPGEEALVGVVGTSRFGDLSTLARVTRGFQSQGAYGIDPILFSKANQFFPLFVTGKRFRFLGPASTLFTSASGTAEAIYFAHLLLRTDQATHVVIFDYEETTDAIADDTVAGEVHALLVGFDTASPDRAGPILAGCRLGSHLGRNGARVDAVRRFLEAEARTTERCLLLCDDQDGAQISAMGGDWPTVPWPGGLVPGVLDLLTGTAPATGAEDAVRLIIVPPGEGNLLALDRVPFPSRPEATR